MHARARTHAHSCPTVFKSAKQKNKRMVSFRRVGCFWCQLRSQVVTLHFSLTTLSHTHTHHIRMRFTHYNQWSLGEKLKSISSVHQHWQNPRLQPPLEPSTCFHFQIVNRNLPQNRITCLHLTTSRFVPRIAHVPPDVEDAAGRLGSWASVDKADNLWTPHQRNTPTMLVSIPANLLLTQS